MRRSRRPAGSAVCMCRCPFGIKIVPKETMTQISGKDVNDMVTWMIGLAGLLVLLVIFCCARSATQADQHMEQLMQSRNAIGEGQNHE